MTDPKHQCLNETSPNRAFIHVSFLAKRIGAFFVHGKVDFVSVDEEIDIVMGEMRVEQPALLNAIRRTITLKRISQTKQTVKEKLPAHNAKFSLDLLIPLIFQQIITACSSE